MLQSLWSAQLAHLHSEAMHAQPADALHAQREIPSDRLMVVFLISAGLLPQQVVCCFCELLVF